MINKINFQLERYEIIFEGSKFSEEEWKKRVKSADDARRAILKIYSYETFFYKALNRANQCKDESAIKTLGPFSCLLTSTLNVPPEANKEKQVENTTHGRKFSKRITLYRGLGLPE